VKGEAARESPDKEQGGSKYKEKERAREKGITQGWGIREQRKLFLALNISGIQSKNRRLAGEKKAISISQKRGGGG